MQRSFLNHDKPLVAAMIESTTMDMCLAHIRTGVFSGADAIAVNYSLLGPAFQNKDSMKRIIDCTPLPTLFFAYREYEFEKKTDEYRAGFQLQAASLGITCCDVMADLFDPSPVQFTDNPMAIRKQKDLINSIHEMGAEVIISSHVTTFVDTATVYSRMMEMADRGADIAKLISYADTPDDFVRSVETTKYLKEHLPIPFIYLCSGKYGPMHRYVSPLLGSAVTFTAPVYSELMNGYQPLTSTTRKVIDELIRGTCFQP